MQNRFASSARRALLATVLTTALAPVAAAQDIAESKVTIQLTLSGLINEGDLDPGNEDSRTLDKIDKVRFSTKDILRTARETGQRRPRLVLQREVGDDAANLITGNALLLSDNNPSSSADFIQPIPESPAALTGFTSSQKLDRLRNVTAEETLGVSTFSLELLSEGDAGVSNALTGLYRGKSRLNKRLGELLYSKQEVEIIGGLRVVVETDDGPLPLTAIVEGTIDAGAEKVLD
jgi:hypothetical protein